MKDIKNNNPGRLTLLLKFEAYSTVTHFLFFELFLIQEAAKFFSSWLLFVYHGLPSWYTKPSCVFLARASIQTLIS